MTEPAAVSLPGRSVPPELLADDVARVARLVAAELLSRVRKKAEDLRAGEDPDALHDVRVALRRLRSWFRAFDDDVRDTLRGKDRRRLGRVADATRTSRDLEVHIAWVDHFAQTRRKHNAGAIEWLLARLRAKKAKADVALHTVLDQDFDRAMAGADKAMSRYTVRLDQQPTTFAERAAKLIRRNADDTRAALARVHTVGDRAQSHEARIAAKRVRYLVDALPESIDGAAKVVERLTQLQDELGALHDAQLFGSQIARMLAKVLSSKASALAKAADDAETIDPPADEIDSDRAEILLAISRRLHRDEAAAFRLVEAHWLGDQSDSLWASVELVATALDRTRPRALRVEAET